MSRHKIQVSAGHLAVWRHLGLESATLLGPYLLPPALSCPRVDLFTPHALMSDDDARASSWGKFMYTPGSSQRSIRGGERLPRRVEKRDPLHRTIRVEHIIHGPSAALSNMSGIIRTVCMIVYLVDINDPYIPAESGID